jgi:hypothetical protein
MNRFAAGQVRKISKSADIVFTRGSTHIEDVDEVDNQADLLEENIHAMHRDIEGIELPGEDGQLDEELDEVETGTITAVDPAVPSNIVANPDQAALGQNSRSVGDANVQSTTASPVQHVVEQRLETDPPNSVPASVLEIAETPSLAPSHKYGLRPRETLAPRERLALHIAMKKALRLYGDVALKEVATELKQMINKKVWSPVHTKDLSKDEFGGIIRSSMFLREKYLSNGIFEKLKARLVAGGDQQDKSIYDDISSPTVSTAAAFITIAVAAKENRHAYTIDIGGAYLNARMKNVKVRMRLDPFLSKELIKLDPSYSKYLCRDNTLVVLLEKALYGCVESAKLWYDHLVASLVRMGFTANRYEPCVMNKMVNGKQATICIHVDDLLVTCTDIEVLEVIAADLEKEYKEVKVKKGKVHSYLGMTLDFSEPGVARITMEGYIQDILRLYEVSGLASTPATDKLFVVNPDSPLLEKSLRDVFHSKVAKLMYLAKRVRPDILPVCTFSATRVHVATEEDAAKLARVLKYLNATKELGLRLEPGDDLDVEIFVDASYGVHGDGKSHTGATVAIGKGSLLAKSSKQKIVAKSSTEAEIIGASDLASEGVFARNFLIEQGYDMKPATLFQDNKSAMAMIDKGRSTSERTRHVNIRYFFLKDRVKSGELKIVYKPTEEMVADILTKPLNGELFRDLRSKLLNWYV